MYYREENAMTNMVSNYWIHCSIYSKCTIIAIALLALLFACLVYEAHRAEKDADFDSVDPWDEGD